jgi:alpha-1,3-rhamnosyltransferase
MISQESSLPAAPGVSVVVPSYNHAQFIEKCLRSIINQTLAPAELIVIDDGSSDGSPEVIAQTLKGCPFPCELIVRPNRGLCSTLNEGLARSRARYFAYLGSDDIWLPTFLEARVGMLERRPDAVLGYGHAYMIDDADQILECTRDWANYVDGDVRDMLLRTTAPFSPTVLYRRDALAKHGWNEHAKLEDYYLYLLLSAEGNFAFDPQVLSAWRYHGSNTSADKALMLGELLNAQCKAAPRLGLSAQDLAISQAAIKLIYAGEIAKEGRKREALSLIRQSLMVAPSLGSKVRALVWLLVPHHITMWRKDLLQQRSVRHYGSIHI